MTTGIAGPADTARAQVFQTLFETVVFGVICLDEEGRIAAANTAAARILGFPKEILTALKFSDPQWETVREDGSPLPEEHHPAMVAIRTGQRVDGVIMGVRSASARRWLRLSAAVVGEESGGVGNHVCCTFEDITQERAATEALRRAEQKYLKLFEGNPLPASVVTQDDRTFLEVNEAFVRTTGYSREELNRLKGGDLDFFEDPKAAEGIYARAAREGGAENQTLRLRMKSGEIRSIVLNIEVIEISGRPCFLSIGHDMTPIIRKEEEARAAGRHHAALFANMKEGVAQLQLVRREGRLVDLKYLAVNPAFEAHTGRKDVVGRLVSEVFPGIWASHPESLPRYEQVEATGIPASYESAEGGRWFAITVYSFDRDNAVLIIANITERKLAEELRREKAEANARVLKAVIGSAPSMMVLLDRKLRVVEVSDVVLMSLGMQRDDVVGKEVESLSAVMPPEWAEAYQRALQGEKLHGVRHRWIHPDGKEQFLDWSIEAWGNDEGYGGEATAGVVIHADDVTVAVRAEAELERVNRLYSVLLHVAQIAAQADKPEDLFAGAVEALVRKGQFDMAWLGLTDVVTKRVVPVASFGDNTGYTASLNIYADNRPEGRGPTGTAVREGHPVVVNDYENDPGTVTFREIARAAGWRGAAVLPIRRGGKVIGGLTTYSHEVGYFGTREVALLEEVALSISSGLDTLDQQARRRAAEEALQRNEERFRQVAEDSGVFVWELDTNGAYTYASPSVTKMLGYTPDELVGHLHASDLIPDELRETGAELVKKLIACGERLQNEAHRRLTKDGRVVMLETTGAPLLDAAGKSVGYRGASRDVTERYSAVARLQESEKQFRQLVEGAIIGILIHAQEKLRYLNPKALELLGAGALQTLLNTSVREILRREASPEEAAGCMRVLEGKHPEPGEFRCVRLDGSEFEAEVSAVPFTTEGNEGSVIFMRDITARKNAEKSRVRLEEQFIQSQKMESVGRLAGGIAHDFNNLLQVINGYSSLALATADAGSRLQQDLQQINEAGERAAQLTQQLLAFSRKQVLETKVLQLNGVVRNTEKILRRLIGEDIRLQSNLAPGLPAVEADPGQLGQVLMNLAVNARDAMPHGGALRLETDVVDLPAGMEATLLEIPPGRYVVLRVSDTGTGMDRETQKAIFEPFFTTKEAGKGTGLGLSTVYGIVHQSNGGIGVESKLGEGTTFQIFLPEANAEVTEIAAGEDSAVSSTGTETILVVEDDSNVRELWVHILSSRGYKVLEAASGPEAIAVANAYRDEIHLLLSDVMLPGFTGQNIRDQLRQVRPGLRVVFITGYTHQVSNTGEPLGEGSFLAKPCSPEQLLAKVREVLALSDGRLFRRRVAKNDSDFVLICCPPVRRLSQNSRDGRLRTSQYGVCPETREGGTPVSPDVENVLVALLEPDAVKIAAAINKNPSGRLRSIKQVVAPFVVSEDTVRGAERGESFFRVDGGIESGGEDRAGRWNPQEAGDHDDGNGAEDMPAGATPCSFQRCVEQCAESVDATEPAGSLRGLNSPERISDGLCHRGRGKKEE